MNLLTFLDDNDEFDVEGFKAAVEVVFTGQEIIVGNADYPTQRIAETTRAFRQLGIGYANLGALLMAQGLPYDSDAGRAWAAAITALLTGHAYATSARTAARMGPFAGYHENGEPMLNVLRMHQAEAARIDEDVVPPELLSAAQEAWDQAVDLAEAYGVRNSQASVLAPTGTIGLLMDCDTTGVEPDLGLVKTKKLVGGGTMSIVNQTVTRALAKLGYGVEQAEDIVAYINEHMSILGAPHIAPEHLPVFACSMGDNTIHYSGHIRMMGAVQPFISGAISKTVNMPEDVTVEDVEQLHIDAWRLGIKAVAIYRDNCKVAQPLSTTKKEADVVGGDTAPAGSDAEARDREVDGPHRRARGGAAQRAEAGDVLGRGRRGARAPAPPAQLEDVLVPGGRLRGLRHGRGVRGRPSGRGVHQGLQAGVDPGRDHGRLLHLAQPGPAARRAAGHLRAQVRQHEVRAGGHHRRPRAAHRHEPRRLHLPPAGPGLPLAGRAQRARHPLDAGADAADASGRGGDVDAVGRARRGRAQQRHGQHDGIAAGGTADGPGRAARCAALLQLRQHHAAGRLVLRLRELRVDQRVLVGRGRPAGLTIDHGVNSIDPMVNTERYREDSAPHAGIRQAGLVPKLVGLYLAIAVATLVVLGLLSAVGSEEATASAWVHAVIVAFFAVLLEIRMRAALRGSRRAGFAVLIIAMVLLVANVIEAAVPGAFPTWMRFEMVAIAALMGGVVITARRERAWR